MDKCRRAVATWIWQISYVVRGTSCVPRWGKTRGCGVSYHQRLYHHYHPKIGSENLTMSRRSCKVYGWSLTMLHTVAYTVQNGSLKALKLHIPCKKGRLQVQGVAAPYERKGWRSKNFISCPKPGKYHARWKVPSETLQEPSESWRSTMLEICKYHATWACLGPKSFRHHVKQQVLPAPRRCKHNAKTAPRQRTEFNFRFEKTNLMLWS